MQEYKTTKRKSATPTQQNEAKARATSGGGKQPEIQENERTNTRAGAAAAGGEQPEMQETQTSKERTNPGGNEQKKQENEVFRFTLQQHKNNAKT